MKNFEKDVLACVAPTGFWSIDEDDHNDVHTLDSLSCIVGPSFSSMSISFLDRTILEVREEMSAICTEI